VKIRLEDVQVEHITFSCPLLSVRQQRKVLFKIAGVAGVPVSSMLGDEFAEAAGKKAETEGKEALMKAFQQVVQSLGDPKTEQVYDELINTFLDAGAMAKFPNAKSPDGYQYQTVKEGYDEIFDQRVDLEARFLWACLEVNFSFLLRRVKGGAKAVLQRLTPENQGEDSKSQEGSTGSSGA